MKKLTHTVPLVWINAHDICHSYHFDRCSMIVALDQSHSSRLSFLVRTILFIFLNINLDMFCNKYSYVQFYEDYYTTLFREMIGAAYFLPVGSI